MGCCTSARTERRDAHKLTAVSAAAAATRSSYWCSNASSGGWAEVDFQCAAAGQLQLPVGMTINHTAKALNNTGPDSQR